MRNEDYEIDKAWRRCKVVNERRTSGRLLLTKFESLVIAQLSAVATSTVALYEIDDEAS